MTDEGYRFPYPPIPDGWHGIAFADQVSQGQVLPVRALGEDLVVYRDDQDEVHVLEAHCPHLGAHLGHGGKVEGSDLVCPFHGWRWAPDGHCAGIPYSKRIPTNARTRAWPCLERNGFVFVWTHAQGETPTWEIEDIPETHDPDFHVVARQDWPPFRSHPQEISENGVDLPHFKTLHGWTAKSIDWVTDGPVYDMVYEMEAMPERWTQTNAEPYSLQSRTEGPTFTRTRFWGAYRGVSAHCFTPVEPGWIRLMQLYYGHRSQTDEENERWFQASDREWAADIPIWNHKRHLSRPLLAEGDGPVPRFRRWYSQFYSSLEMQSSQGDPQ
ncbi:Rieske 2Fe-2S domain-containing protein [Myxococcota bacterium]|nr:Rieske 2Fe-2S domain-containing protein [Myxococcota bacterium]